MPSATSAPLGEDGEAVAALGFVHVVSRHQDGRAGVGELEQALPEIAAALRIDGAGGLVEQQQLGRVQRRRRERQALLLAAAHGAGALLAQAFRGCRWRAAARCAPATSPVEAVQIRDELQVLVGGEVLPQRELLRHVAEPAADGLGVLHHREPEHFRVPIAGQQHAAQHAQRRGFARAVGAEEAVDAAGGNVEVDVIDRGLVAEFSRELPRRDGRRRGRPGGAVHGAESSSVTSTGTPDGSEAPPARRTTTSARKLSLRAIGRGERVVRRELGLAGDEAHLAAVLALHAVDADGGRRAGLDARADLLGHVNARVGRGGGQQHGDRRAARGLLADDETAARRWWRRWARALRAGRKWFRGRRDWRARCRRPGAPAPLVRRACPAAVRAGPPRLRAGWPRRHAAAATCRSASRLADQAAGHQAEQPVALAHGVVALHARGVAARRRGANASWAAGRS